MRIVHVVVSLDPALGGPPAVASRLAAAQAAIPDTKARASSAAHQVTLTSHGSPGRESQVQASLGSIPGISSVSIVALPPQHRIRAFFPQDTRRQLRQLLPQADIVHLHGIWEPIIRIASVECRKLGKPYVITTHGILDPWCLRQRWLKKKIAMKIAYRSMLESAGALHTLNRDEADLIAPLRLSPRKWVIPNGVFLDEIEPLPPPGSFHAKHPELKGQPFVLFLGRLHFKKGLDYLAEAFAIVAKANPALRLVVAGPDDGAKSDFEDQVSREDGGRLRDRVHLVGPLWGAEKFAAMVDAACFCLPSRQEGFSMAVTEAMACGTPVVISEACHFPEVAEAGAGEVVPLASRPVAAAIDRFVSNPALAAEIGQAGRRLVLTRFTWPTIAQQTIEMYESVRAGR
jgi:glycosyltransferase involved in cell wall biosynthesis